MSFLHRIKSAIQTFRTAGGGTAPPGGGSQPAAGAEPECDERDALLASLTPRETQVLALLLQGKRMREIAELLGVKSTTVSFHMTSLYKKLSVHDRAHLILQYGALRKPAAP